MKSLSHIYENLLDEGNIIRTMYRAFSGKNKTESVKRFLAPESIGRNADMIRQSIISGILPAQTPRRPKIIHEPAAGKDRIIYPPNNCEHVLHHLVCQELEPMFSRGMYEFCVASVPGRGDSYGRKYMQKWIRSHNGKKLYVLKIDIHHFFDSINRSILFCKLAERIHDLKFLDIVRRIIWYDGDECGVGIPIGFYTSQWFANFYLQDFDYYVKQTLCAVHYMRYMDDIVVIDTNKRKLWRIFYAIESYLKSELCLEINANWQLFRFSYIDRNTGKEKGRAIDFMGYVFHCNRTCMRKRTLHRARRKANKIAKRDDPSWYESTQMISRAGRMKYCQVYGYFARWIEPKISMKKLRKAVSNYSRKKSRTERMKQYV